MLGTGGASATQPPVMHFGSLYGETDYESKAHILSAALAYQFTPQINFHLQGNLTNSEAAFDPIEMPQTVNRTEAEDIVHAADYDYSMIHDYSNLKYALLNLRAGMQYQFLRDFAFTFDVDYYDLTDDQGYVYGNESGTFYIVRTGFVINRFSR